MRIGSDRDRRAPSGSRFAQRRHGSFIAMRWSLQQARALLFLCICSACGASWPAPSRAPAAPVKAGVDAKADSRGTRGWVLAYEETFDAPALSLSEWSSAPLIDPTPFADDGSYFRAKGITPPTTYRASSPIGRDGWLTVESASRSSAGPPSDLAQTVLDPAGGTNRVLRVRSPAHTDATIVRPTKALPEAYRVSVRVGFPSFGDGKPGKNGYDTGNETAEPWSANTSAVDQNGFYWLTILDTLPRPHNNTWIHHHRKVVVDSDNHSPPWMQIWNGTSFVDSGEHPIMLFAIDGRGPGGNEQIGKPFLSYSAGAWQPSGAIRAVDAYKPRTWYTVTITRKSGFFTISLEGEFAFGGQKKYEATIDAAEKCVFHENRPGETAGHCVDDRSWADLGAQHPHWPAGEGWADWFMFGDPHENYYEGEVYYDDVRLEIWSDSPP